MEAYQSRFTVGWVRFRASADGVVMLEVVCDWPNEEESGLVALQVLAL